MTAKKFLLFPATGGPVSSAGVFDSTGLLVRTLWSASKNDPRASSPAAAWDGRLDDGTVAPTGTYTIQVLNGNVTYTWEGVVGNSGAQPHTTSLISSNQFGGFNYPIFSYNYHAHGFPLVGMCITDAGEIYSGTQYDERIHTINVSSTADPQTNNTILGNAQRDVWMQAPNPCCTDSIKVYFPWNAVPAGPGQASFVFGFDLLPRTPSQLTSGVDESVTRGTDIGSTAVHTWGVFDYADPGDGTSFINSVAVQKTGNFLFATRSGLNTIYTGDKTTGASLQTFTSFVAPELLATNPVTDDLWVVHLNVSPPSPVLAAINFRGAAGNQVTANFAAASFTYTAPAGFSPLTVGTTFDPATATSGIVLSGGNLIATVPSSTGNEYVYSTVTGSKFYFEVVMTVLTGAGNTLAIGISDNTTRPGGWLGDDADSAGNFDGDGSVWIDAVSVHTVATYAQGDNIGVAVDMTKNLIWFRKNGGNWNNSATANPATSVGGIFTNTIGGSVTTSIISKMTVDGSGNLTDSGLAITSLTAEAIAISPDGSMLLVADGAVGSQQVKAFNTSDGSVKTAWGTSGVFGSAGGYLNSPAVTNTKFMFSDPNGYGSSNLCFAPDASFWVYDPGNNRNLHFSSGNSPAYIEQVTYLPLEFYAGWVCHNDDTRVFAQFMEYKIDYTKPLDNGTNGSWTLVNNWFAGRPVGAGTDEFDAMRFAGTYSNGRTYAPVYDGSNRRIMELTSSGLRDTGVIVNASPNLYIDRQFNLWSISNASPGQQVVYKRNSFTGFDGSGNPTFQTSPSANPTTTVLTSQVLPANFPYTGNNGNIPSYMVEPLANGVIPTYDPDFTNAAPHNGNKIGGIDSSSGLVKFMAHPSSAQNRGLNAGPDGGFLSFPEKPVGDVFQGNANSGGAIWYKPGAVDFFTGYPGESWGNNQTNVWSHWHQTGLLIGRFGTAAPYYGRQMNLDGSLTSFKGANFWQWPILPTQITIACWINPSVLDATQRTVYTATCVEGSYSPAWLGVVNSNVSFYYRSLATPHQLTAGSIATGNWYRIVATVNGSGAALYVNGAQIATGPGLSLYNKDGVQIQFGGGINPASGLSTFFGGSASDLAIWNTVLTPTQITNLTTQRANSIGANANLVGYWPIQGTPVENDQSGNGNNSQGGIPVVAGPPGFPTFNGVNNARSFNGTSNYMSFFPSVDYQNNSTQPLKISSYRGMPGLAGNAKWGGLALQSGSYFLYHNDEWYHGGKHRWRVDNLSSVTLGSPVTVNWNSGSYTPPGNGPPDLLASLPFDTANLPNNTGGWVRSPTSDTSIFKVYTNAVHGWRFSTPDLVFIGTNNSGTPTGTLSKSWTRSGSGDWSMIAEVVFNGLGESASSRGLYIDILDNTGKKLVRMETSRYATTSPSFQQGFFIDGVAASPTFDSVTNVWNNYYQGTPRPLTVIASVGGGTMQVTYGDFTTTVGVFDAGADITKPSQFQLTWTDGQTASGAFMGVSFTKLMFLE